MIVRFLISSCFFAVATVASAVAECVRPIGALPSLQGQAMVQDRAAGIWRPAALNEQLCPGDVIHVGERSRIEVTIAGQPNVRLDQNTALRVPSEDNLSIVRLLYGAAYFFSRHPRRLTVDTPFVDAAVEGTEFLVRVETERTLIIVFAGRVRASNPHGELAIAGGKAALAEAGRAPAPYLIVRPRDAVQWTLFYPAILPALVDPSGAAAQQLPEPLRGALTLAAAGQLPAAFARFEAIPETERDADYYLYRAATLLSVGRVEEARADTSQALLRDPSDGRADALSAVIAVAQNDRDRALEDARRAVKLSPQSAAARIALSYAEQARFQIEPARQALEQGVKNEPENALAWARLSELWLMQGRRERARKAAKKARELAPELARVQTVLGFAELAEINTGRAKKAFRRAIDLDSANPLPRFGLGLATIRAGDLEQGRKEIEIAVALDPENALLRSYLGKAYFDERTTDPLTYFQELVNNFPNQENTLAAEQFAIAKQLDPNDPTPWLYDAIRKQSENRPVEALREIEKSIELNDNRAVYRSRELLDQDQAARGTSLARVYNDLGFQQLGINEATKSLSLDPSNAGAHRFLSDVYTTQPRSEIARVSELLQAQLLQDININPVQPSLSETNLGIATSGGPARPGFNEFTPLFERNQAQLNTTAVVGNDWTRGGETVVSGIYDKLSLSAGQYLYKANGFRKNFEVRDDISDLFAQAAITPNLNVQAEFRRRRLEHGEIGLFFDPLLRTSGFERDLDQDSGRLGARYSPTPQSDILYSFIYSKRHEKGDRGDDPRFRNPPRIHQEGSQNEVQYIGRSEAANLVAGFAYYNVDTKNEGGDSIEHTKWKDRSAYIYTNLDIQNECDLTFGVSYDDFNNRSGDVKAVSPKAGVRCDLSERLRLRLAALRAVKPALVTNQTIEPTQVAGFNQFYDDFNGTKAWLFGIGLDLNPISSVYTGVEVVYRELDYPVESASRKEFSRDADEQMARAYIYWTPLDRLAITSGFTFDLIRLENFEAADRIKSSTVPLFLNYFHPSGLFATAGPTYVWQDVKNNTGRPEGKSDFFLIDAAIGYRLPKRYGIASLSFLNMTNERFNYLDETFRTPADSPTLSRFIPERTILGRLTLSF